MNEQYVGVCVYCGTQLTQYDREETSETRKQRAMASVIKAFDNAVDPKNLTPQEYIDFTQELISDLQIRLEAAVEESNR